MSPEVKQAISAFYDAVEELKRLDVIRSDKFLGDIAEYITAHIYNIELARSGREVGHDGIDKDGKVQVKYHGSPTKTNVDLGRPNEYDKLLVVLGPDSLLRHPHHTDDFLIYKFTSVEVRQFANAGGSSHSCGKSPFVRKPDQVMNL